MRVVERNVAVGLGIGGAVIAGWWAWRRRLASSTLPHTWEEVGEVSELIIYPLKSARGIYYKESEATIYGLSSDQLEDRCFMVIKEDGSIVNSRQAETLAAVGTQWKGCVFTLTAQGYEDVSLDLERDLKDPSVLEANLLGMKLPGVDCGDKMAEWLSRVLYNGKTQVRLIYKGEVLNRQSTKPDYFEFNQYRKQDRCNYSNVCSFLICTQSSLDDLNSRLSEPVVMGTFRPNIVVSGCKAYDEDDWVYVKIGQVVLRRLKPCERCLSVTVDPVTGKHRENKEPLTTLKKYRLLSDPPELAKIWNANPIFGVQLSTESTGHVAVGDKVSIARASLHPHLRGY